MTEAVRRSRRKSAEEINNVTEEFEPPEGRRVPTTPEPIQPETPTAPEPLLEKTRGDDGGREPFNFVAHGKRRFPGGYFVRASNLRAGEHNTRIWTHPENVAAIKEMAETIMEGINAGQPGIRNAIRYVYRDYFEGDQLEIDDGQIRWRAVLYLEGGEFAPGMFGEKRVDPDTIPIPVVPADHNRNDKARDIDFVVGNIHNRPKALELARSFARMQNLRGMTQEAIAKAIGRNQSYVSQTMALNKVSTDLQDHIASGKIASTTVVNVIRDHGDGGEAAIKKAIEASATGGGDVVRLDEHRPSSSSAGSQRSRSTRSRQGAGSGNRTRGRVTAREVARHAGDHDKSVYNEGNFKTLLQAIRNELQGDWASDMTRERLNAALKEIGLTPIEKAA